MKNSNTSNIRSELPPELLSRYEPQKCLAHNAISETYLVKSRKDGREYVAKIYDRFFLKEGSDERAILKRLNHPALPNLIESVETGELVCVIRDYVKGVTLDKLNIPLKERSMLNIGAQLCDILTYLHNRKPPIIHRDLKPSNVIINSANKVSLIDFDISREYDDTAVRDTTLAATDGFSPPEQYGFRQTDALADIYSFGCLMCWLLTGSTNVSEMDGAKNRSLVKVLKKCTAFSPKDRYKTAKSAKAALFRACNKGTIIARVVTAAVLFAFFEGGFLLGRLTAPADVSEQKQERDSQKGQTEEPLPNQFSRQSREYRFKDPFIEKNVRIMLAKPDGIPITIADLEIITELCVWGDRVIVGGTSVNYWDMNAGDISSIEDLQYMKNLQSLILMRQPNLSDISPLAGLDNLERLAIMGTNVTDFTPLNSVFSLKKIISEDPRVSATVFIEGSTMALLSYDYNALEWAQVWGD